MNKYVVVYLISLFGTTMLFSCSKNIEIDLPVIESKPVINCLFTQNEPFNVNISLTKAPTDTTMYFVDNAQVFIKEENGSEYQLTHRERGFYTNADAKAQTGVRYELHIKIAGFPNVLAQSKVPDNKFKILEIQSTEGYETEPVMGTGEEARIKVQNLKLQFIQDAQIINYMGVTTTTHSIRYHFVNDSVFLTEDNTRLRRGYLRTNDPSIINEGLESYFESEVLLFRDFLFDDEKATVSFNLEKKTSSGFWLHFFQFSPEAFNYLKSWIIHDYTKDYDFWEVYEPLPLYSNIENGYGIFAGYSSQVYEVWPDSTITFE